MIFISILISELNDRPVSKDGTWNYYSCDTFLHEFDNLILKDRRSEEYSVIIKKQYLSSKSINNFPFSFDNEQKLFCVFCNDSFFINQTNNIFFEIL